MVARRRALDAPGLKGGAAMRLQAHRARIRSARALRAPACRCCGAPVRETFVDLGMTPLGAGCVPPARLAAPSAFRQLKALFCSECLLVQLPEGEGTRARRQPDEDDDAAERLAARFAARAGLGGTVHVAEVGSGDGSRLLPFARRGMQVLGIEPEGRMAAMAETRGVPTEAEHFGAAAARRLRGLGHAPGLILVRGLFAAHADPHDLTAGLRILLAPGGEALLELSNLLPLLRGLRFDEIRHDRLSYYSLATAAMLLEQHGLVIRDVERGETDGTIRLIVCHVEDQDRQVAPALAAMRREEAAAGLHSATTYRAFEGRVVEAKCALLDFLVGLRRAGRRVAGYGPPGAVDAILGYCGVGAELLPFVVDPDGLAAGRHLPRTCIGVRSPDAIEAERPDFVLALPMLPPALRARMLDAVSAWGGCCVTALPTIQILRGAE